MLILALLFATVAFAEHLHRYAIYLNSIPLGDADAPPEKQRPQIIDEVADWLKARNIEPLEREDTPYFKVIVANLDHDTIDLLNKPATDVGALDFAEYIEAVVQDEDWDLPHENDDDGHHEL